MERRNFVQNMMTFGAFIISPLLHNKLFARNYQTSEFTLPKLPYAYDALEPHIDAQTMEIHHSKHHAAYINNLNKELSAMKVNTNSVDGICKQISNYSSKIRNNAGGHFNHSFFWESLTNKQAKVEGNLSKAIINQFGSVVEFKTQFEQVAKNTFGSGWAWLIFNKDSKLEIVSTPNQDNPLMDISPVKGIPIFAVDVWEHAYYLKYQNKRSDYLNAIWNIVNWDKLEDRYNKAVK